MSPCQLEMRCKCTGKVTFDWYSHLWGWIRCTVKFIMVSISFLLDLNSRHNRSWSLLRNEDRIYSPTSSQEGPAVPKNLSCYIVQGYVKLLLCSLNSHSLHMTSAYDSFGNEHITCAVIVRGQLQHSCMTLPSREWVYISVLFLSMCEPHF